METNITRGTAETASLAGSVAQSSRYKDRDARKADSVVRNEVVYFSPVIRIDPDTQTAIIQYRDSNTGKVTNEYPTEKQMESYERSAQVAEKAPPAPVEVKEIKVEKKAEAPKEKPEVEHIDQDV